VSAVRLVEGPTSNRERPVSIDDGRAPESGQTGRAPESGETGRAPESGETGGIDRLLDRARQGLERLDPREAAAAIDRGALLIDIRPEAQRRREGEIPGAVLIERNVLEWRLAPSSPQRIPELVDEDQVVIVVCSEGYASSFAAATLQRVGLPRATDLVGGFLAWEAAGLPAVPFGFGRVRRLGSVACRIAAMSAAFPRSSAAGSNAASRRSFLARSSGLIAVSPSCSRSARAVRAGSCGRGFTGLENQGRISRHGADASSVAARWHDVIARTHGPCLREGRGPRNADARNPDTTG